MAQSVSTMTSNIRVALADVEGHRFSNANILTFLNKAYRKVYSVFAHDRPELVKTVESGDTVAGTAEYSVGSGSLRRVLSLHVDSIPLSDLGQAPEGEWEAGERGRPQGFYVSGWDSVTLVPAPDGVYPYRIAYVAQPSPLTDGSTTWPDDFDDLMEEFVVMRLGIIDEGDPSMEAQFLQDLERRTRELLADMAPLPHVVQPFWGTAAVTGDY